MSEYMTLIPAAVMVAISLSVVAGFLINSLTRVVNSFEPYGNTCEVEQKDVDEGPIVAEAGDHTVTLCAAVYNEADDTTTLTYCVESTCPIPQPVVEEKEKCNNGVGNGEEGCNPGNAPNNDEGEECLPGSPCAKDNNASNKDLETEDPGNAGGNKTGDEYELTNIAFSLDLPADVLAGIKAGEAELSSNDEIPYTIKDGKLYINYSYADHGLSCDPPEEPEPEKENCNNGVGNGEEGCNPGNAPNNDEGEECVPGSPCAKDNNPSNDKNTTGDDTDPEKGNNGVGNGEDPQPPGDPQVNDGEGTSPGDPGAQGGVGNDKEKDNNGKKNASFSAPMSSIVLASAVDAPVLEEDPYSQEAQGELAGQVNVLISGQYAYAEVNLGVVNRGTIITTKITAPVRYYDPALDEACAED